MPIPRGDIHRRWIEDTNPIPGAIQSNHLHMNADENMPDDQLMI